MEVPDASRYSDFLFSPFQDFNTEHINHFSPVSMANLMGNGGFSLKEQGQKRIEAAPNMPYPVLYSVWLKDREPISDFSPVRDSRLEEEIKAYIVKSRAMMDAIEAKLRLVLAESSQVIVWGTGQLAMKLLTETSLAQAQIRIVAFVDGNPINQGKTLRNIPILSPEQIRAMPQPIIVTTILHQQEIFNQVRHMGLSNEVVLLGQS